MSKSKKRAPLGQRLIKAMGEILDYAEGRTTLRTTEVFVPDPPPQYSPDRIIAIRKRLNLTQFEFARFLNVSKNAVESWEQGVRVPGGNTARLLQFVESPETLKAMLAKAQTPPRSRKG